VTRFKVEFEVAVKDSDEDAYKKFASDLNHFLGSNVPAHSGWAKSGQPEKIERVFDMFDADRPVDPRWTAILHKVDEIEASGKPMSMRGTAMVTAPSGAHPGVMYCKAVFYDDRTLTKKSLYLIGASQYRPQGTLSVTVDGPYEDASDQYWIGMAEHDKRTGNGVITPDWIHRTVSKDIKNFDCAGHGGREFKFLILEPDANAKALLYQGRGLVVTPDETGKRQYVLVTRNCWYQGYIPEKHRHLFEVNVELLPEEAYNL
jgi:hypothetical protein